MKAENIKKEKIYSVTMIDGVSILMSNVQAVDFEGIPCLRGIHLHRDSWTKGIKYYLCVDKIKAISEFNSMKQYYAREKLYDKYEKE